MSLTQACFIDKQYEQHAFQKCFSNLLGVGFRQFVVDTYWDQLRSVWSLCPVELPQSNNINVTGSVQSTPTVTVSTDSVSAAIPQSSVDLVGKLGFKERQASAQTVSTSVAPSSTTSLVSSGSPSSPSASATPSVVSFPTADGPPLLQIGSYNCTSLVTLELLTGILEDFLESTSTTTGAAIILLSFDVHAAFSLSNPNGPAPQLSPNQLPVSGSLLSEVLKGNLSDHTYTPSRLSSQRGNLNSSWYDVEWPNRPLQGYYRDSKNADDNLFTEEGWPTEAYMEFKELFRLVLSYGTIDPQMQYYNIGPDLDYVFPPGTLNKSVRTAFGPSGQVSSGCLFALSEPLITSETNSSWAISSPPSLDINANPDLMVPISSVANLTSCGLSPLLNQSLATTTADKNPLPYAAYVHSTLWTWAPGEPLNSTSGTTNTANRCVVLTMYPYAGRWRVVDCADRFPVACHVPSEPYNWQISAQSTNYAGADSVCGSKSQFSIPHTSLENAHLLAALQNHRQTAPNEDTVLLNLNSLGVTDCWVVGLNGTCPYLPSTDTNRTRIVVVPLSAAVIIFVLAILTFFVKCAANRTEGKRGRRRRLVDGWEYEGVPS